MPQGIHRATWADIVARYGYTVRRLELLAGLKAGLDALRLAGCEHAYINGSFVTAKQQPGDFDVCWESTGVRIPLLDPALRTFANQRAAQKAAFQGEFFPAELSADGLRTYLDFFQRDRAGGLKGIIAIELKDLP